MRFSSLPPARGTVYLRAPFDAYTGYGQHACAVVSGLLKEGYAVRATPLRRSSPPPEVAATFCAAPDPDARVLLLDTPQCSLPIEAYWFTMHETTRLPEAQYARLLRAEHVIVPSTWNAQCFSAQGLQKPIHVCPLGFDPELYFPVVMPNGVCTFGVLGTPSLSNAARKNFDLALRAFRAAFQGVRDVRLRFKQTPTCARLPTEDPRVEFISEIFSPKDLRAWYSSLHALVLPSRGEAWAFPALHAMACGRPVIAAAFGGLQDYFGPHCGYPVPYRLESPKNVYEDTGLWAEPDFDSMVESMRFVYRHRDQVAQMGSSAAAAVATFTWHRSVQTLLDILHSTGYFESRRVAVSTATALPEASLVAPVYDVAAPGSVNAARLPVRPAPILAPVPYGNTCFVHLGRYGDLLNLMPVLKHAFDETGRKPNLLVSKDFQDVAHWGSYFNVEVWDGPACRTAPAVAYARKRFPAVILTQPCAEDHQAEQHCDSYAKEVWRVAGLLREWGRLPLVLDRRNLYRESALVTEHVRSKRPVIVYNLKSHSSPFAHADEVALELHREWGHRYQLLDLSTIKAYTLIDLLGIMDRAACLITADSALLHLAAASRVPVVAFITDQPSLWHGTAPRCRVAHAQRYSEPIDFDRIHRTIDRLTFRRFVHVYSDYKDTDPSTQARFQSAQQSWPAPSSHWIPCAVPENAVSTVQSKPKLKELINYTVESVHGSLDDVVVYTNRDIAMVSDALPRLQDALLNRDAVFCYRRDLMAPARLNHAEALREGVAYDGCDLFAFTRSWWLDHRDQLGDFVIGAPEWDRALRRLIEAEGDGALDGLILHVWHDPAAVTTAGSAAAQHNLAVAGPAPKPRRSRFGRDVDRIRAFYRQQKPAEKHPLLDFRELALSNNPTGIGDALLLTALPRISAEAGRYVHSFHDTEAFRVLMRYNPWYKPYDGRPTVSADLLQTTFAMGNGHFTQRLQRAFGFHPDLRPGGVLVVPDVKRHAGKCALHFDAGAHAQWQRQHLHPRARELYAYNRGLLEDFIKRHRNDMTFCEVGSVFSGLDSVQDCTGLPLNQSVEVLASCEWFIGIVSGPMHVANALGVKCVVIVNFPHADQIVLPTLVDISQVESEWLYPQAVHLHQDSDSPLVRSFSVRHLEAAIEGSLYPYWTDAYLDLIHEPL